MQKTLKDRIFYLDFIRAIAVLLILITHYNAIFVFVMSPPMYDRCILFETPFGIYVGDLGVSLFLIISGAALMYVYDKKLELKKFYKKRFLSIYPMFWLAYLVAFLPNLGTWKNMGLTNEKWKFILSFLGIDGYLSEYFVSFYVLGEWFLGFIVIFYIIFPFLRWCMKKNEIVMWILVIVVYFVTLKFYNLEMTMSKCILVRLPELCFGMSFIRHRCKVKWYMVVPALGVLVANLVIKPAFLASLQTTYVGIAFFLCLVFISEYCSIKPVRSVCAFLTKYSYAIFLTHHVIIVYVQAAFDISVMSVLKSYVVFAVTTCIIMIVSVLLQKGTDSFMLMFKSKNNERIG